MYIYSPTLDTCNYYALQLQANAMFAQFRNAVEQLAQETTRALENAALAEGQTEAHSRSQSVDTPVQRAATAPSSSQQLADSALLSLRKSLVSQRAGTSPPTTGRSGSPAPAEKRLPKSNLNLEERLRRATTGIPKPSGSSTPNRSPPNRSNTASPLPISKNSLKESPSSLLPASPAVIAVAEDDSKLAPPELSLQEPPPPTSEVQPTTKSKEGETNCIPDPSPLVEDVIPVPIGDTPPKKPPKEPSEEEINDIPSSSPLVEGSIPLPVEDTPPKDKEDGAGVIVIDNSHSTSIENIPVTPEVEPPKDKDDVVVERDSSVNISLSPIEAQLVNQVEECPNVVADVVPERDNISLAEKSHAISLEPKSCDEVKMDEISVSSSKTVSAADHSAEVEKLQERLRQVEQRFSGMLNNCIGRS